MTLNGAITQLVLLSEHPMMPVIFRPAIQKIIETISELEAQPEQRWVPVTDEEPDLYKRVIVTWEYGSKRYTAEASRQERNGTTFYKAESPDLFRYNPLKVVAWQEKPEPWEGDAE